MAKDKVEIVLDIVSLAPVIARAVVKGIPIVADAWENVVKALKDGISPEEHADLVEDRDAILNRIIEKTNS